MEDSIFTDNTKGFTPANDGPRANEMIKVREVRLILSNGDNIGVVPTREAIYKAQQEGLDLVEISPNSVPPVCKILDFGKYKYELQKRKNETKKKQKVVEIKEIKLTPMIDIHDFNVKLKAAQRFLTEGNKVKFTLKFRGREMSYQDQGVSVLNRMQEQLADIAKVELEPKLEGKMMGMRLAPIGAKV